MPKIDRLYRCIALMALLMALTDIKAQSIDFSKFPFIPRTPPMSLADLVWPEKAQPAAELKDHQMGLYVPTGAGPFPAVVLSPTCGGVGAHMKEWARFMLDAGYAVLILDHMTQRQAGNICGKRSDLHFWQGTKDAYAALDYLATVPSIDAKKVSLVGFSWGGAVAYFLASKSMASDSSMRSKSRLRYAATVGVYPVCHHWAWGSIPEIAFIRPDVDRPVLSLMAQLDHEEPTAHCEKMLQMLQSAGQPVQWQVYVDTTHAWDRPEVNGRRSKAPWMPNDGQFIYSEAMTRRSMADTLDFLKQHLK